MKTLIALSLVLGGCCTTTVKPEGPNPLAVANCPALTPLTDDSFGATTTKLLKVTEQYYKCREAGLTEVKE